MSKSYRCQESRQRIARFESKSYVIQLPPNIQDHDQQDIAQLIRQRLSVLTGWQPSLLQVVHQDDLFCSVRSRSCIRGGKGGFGSLLKNQSKQASANTTKSYGLCRDLQGRRLRHVNDTIDRDLFQSWKEKVENNTATIEDMIRALGDTQSGIANWHLQLPSWTEVSVKKEKRNFERLLKAWKEQHDTLEANKNKKRQLREAQIAAYTEESDTHIQQQQELVQTAVARALGARKNEEKMNPTGESETVEQPSKATQSAYVTLAGEAIVDGSTFQGNSNFASIGIALDPRRVDSNMHLYLEVVLITGGLVQIGWASPDFRANSETGDGVGDGATSYAFDGSRCITLHTEQETKYGKAWKPNDVVGCHYDNGTISYSLNGQHLGIAFRVSGFLFPVISCNGSEQFQLRIDAAEFDYAPAGATAVGDVLADGGFDLASLLATVQDTSSESKPIVQRTGESTAAVDLSTVEDSKPEAKELKAKPSPQLEDIDLACFKSASELEALGLDRLKFALQTRGLKCGGRLEERAKRLLSVRGLDPAKYPAKLLAKGVKQAKR